MINCIEYTLKNFNRERTLTKILQVCEVKNVKIFEDTYSFQVNKKNKKKVNKILDKFDIKVLNTKYKGVISFLNNTIFRIGIIIPIVLFLIFLCVSNAFVFDYKVFGNELVSYEEIENVLTNQDITGITKKSNIDTTKLTNALQEIDKVSLVSVVIKGNTLIINIKEKVYNSEYEDKGEFVPLVSGFNGIVTEISLIQGTPLVKVGQTVKVGQKLVAPYVTDTQGQILSVRPMADIKADVFLTTITQVPDTLNKMIDTGNTIKNKTISLFNIDIFSRCNTNAFKCYRKEEKTISMSNNIILPIKIKETVFYEQTEQIIEDYYNSNKDEILQDCQQKTRQLVESCEIIKEEYKTITKVANINQISYTVVVNKSIC